MRDNVAFIGKANEQLTPIAIEVTEGLSCDFCIQIIAVSKQPDLVLADWLNKPLGVEHVLAGDRQVFHGMVSAIASIEADDDGDRRYQLILSPQYSSLSLTTDCRIFQQQSLMDIAKKIFTENHITDVDYSRLAASYEPLDYSVIYNESYHDYLQRMFANAGVYYYYAFEADKHTLVLLDGQSAKKKKVLPLQLMAKNAKDQLARWETETAFEVATTSRGLYHRIGVSPILRISVTLSDAEPASQYCLTRIQHTIRMASDNAEHNNASEYQADFQARIATAPFVPSAVPQPIISGPQTAMVTGPNDKMRYADEYGRIKVRFHWDSAKCSDENRSCWIPVAQLQTGDQYGCQLIPRVGDEVVVDFLNGNIDKPIVIGSVYNNEQKTPFPTDSATAIQSGIQTKLSDNKTAGHSLVFNDSPGKEFLSLHSAGDYTLSAENDLLQKTSQDEKHVYEDDVLLTANKGDVNLSAKGMELRVGSSKITIDSNGVGIHPAGKLLLKAKGVNQEYSIATVGDKHHCPKLTAALTPHNVGPVLKGSQIITIGGLPAARVGDKIQCTGSLATIKKGAASVTFDNKPVAHLNSQSDHGGKIIKAAGKAYVSPRQDLPAFNAAKEAVQKPLKPDDIAEVIYDVTCNEYYALTTIQLEQLLSTADPVMSSLEELDEAVNKEVDPKDKDALSAHQKAIVAAKSEVNKNMKGMANGPDDIKITELIHFIGKDPTVKNTKGKYPWLNRKHTYVHSDKMKPHWRSYRLDKDLTVSDRVKKLKQFHEKMKDPTTGKLSRKRILHAAAKAMQKNPLQLNIADFNAAAAYKTFTTTAGNEHFNASASAQLFRATAGAGANAGYNKKSGKFSFSADGHAEADLVNAHASITAYIPSREGFSINVYLPDSADLKTAKFRQLHLGQVRVKLEAGVDGFVGATVAAGANLNLTLKKAAGDSTGGKKQAVKLLGNNKPSPTTRYNKKTPEKADADKNGLKTNINAFVGAKAEGNIDTGIYWQNPDSREKTQAKVKSITGGKSDKELTKEQVLAKKNSEDEAWLVFGDLDAAGSAAIGAGLGLGFSIGFNLQEGKFYIRAHAELVCGAGVSGDIAFEIDAGHIFEFVAFVYHKIKDQNFSFVGLFGEAAFGPFINLLTKFLLNDIATLEDLVEDGIADINNWWHNIKLELNNSEMLLEKAEQAASNINQNPTKLKYTIPEVKGRLLYLFTQQNLQAMIAQQAQRITSEISYGVPYSPESADNIAVAQAQEIQQAIVHILSYVQNEKDFENVIQHMTYDGSKLPDALYQQREHTLYDGLGFYGRYQARKNPHVNALVQELRNNRVYMNAAPTRNTPVVQNHGVLNYV